MKTLTRLFTILLISVLLSACGKNATKPNILFIMSDDHTTQAFGIYGSRLASLNPSPNLDQLASEGMIFSCTSWRMDSNNPV